MGLSKVKLEELRNKPLKTSLFRENFNKSCVHTKVEIERSRFPRFPSVLPLSYSGGFPSLGWQITYLDGKLFDKALRKAYKGRKTAFSGSPQLRVLWSYKSRLISMAFLPPLTYMELRVYYSFNAIHIKSLRGCGLIWQQGKSYYHLTQLSVDLLKPIIEAAFSHYQIMISKVNGTSIEDQLL